MGHWLGRKICLLETAVVKRETEITAFLRRGQELSQTSWNKRRLEIYARILSRSVNISQQEKGCRKKKTKKKEEKEKKKKII